MKKIVFYLFIVTLTLFSGCKNAFITSKKAAPPNIIIILADDLGFHDVGFNGCEDIPTPNIDRIANEGVKFTNGYVSYTVCGPSRAGLITGRYQDRFGFGRNPLFTPKDPQMGLPLSEETMATALKKAGYRTMAIGKWHLGAHESLRPLNRGFDEFFGFLTGGHQYFPELLTLKDISEVKSQFDAYKTRLLHNNTRVEIKEYLTDALSAEAVHFVERNTDKPFFLYLAYNAPHTPLQATEKYLSRFSDIKNKKRRTYAAMVSALDDGVGRLLDTLESLKIADNTIVFFLSDNGGPTNKNGSNNDPLRAGKGSMYDGGIHVPFAMRWPRVIPAGKVYEKPVISLDIFATVAKYARAKPTHPLDGINIVPYLLGKKKGQPHDFLAWRKFDQHRYAVRSGDFKLVNEGNDELYNLTKDIGERNALTDQTKMESLLKLKDQWTKQMIDPVFLGLVQNALYNKLHPDRWENVEPY